MAAHTSGEETPGIGTLAEQSLHAALKDWYTQPGDRLEVRVSGYVIDIVRGDLLIEIQTGNFSALKRKLGKLVEGHPVRLVHPIPRERWIVRLSADGRSAVSRRKSPKRGRVEDLFVELVRLPILVAHPNFSVEVLLIQEEVILYNDGKGSWRRKGWSIHDRRLLDVVDRAVFESPPDFVPLLPSTLPDPFTTRDLAGALGARRSLAQKMAYCLRKMDVIRVVDRRGNALVYSLAAMAGNEEGE
jgi:hypothetical protein